MNFELLVSFLETITVDHFHYCKFNSGKHYSETPEKKKNKAKLRSKVSAIEKNYNKIESMGGDQCQNLQLFLQ